MKEKINPRLSGRSSHIGGPINESVNPNEMTEEAINEKRAAKEALEDAELFREY